MQVAQGNRTNQNLQKSVLVNAQPTDIITTARGAADNKVLPQWGLTCKFQNTPAGRAGRKMKMMTLDQMKDKDLGEIGTPERDKYEFDLKMEVLGDMIKSVRKERKLTQEQLGELIGVQKSQISKLVAKYKKCYN